MPNLTQPHPQEKVAPYMSRNGYTQAGFARTMGVCHKSVQRWIQNGTLVKKIMKTRNISVSSDLSNAIKRDKYYTKSITAKLCYNELNNYLISQGFDPKTLLFLEPSAGSGVFLDVINQKIEGFDIAPEDAQNRVRTADFLSADFNQNFINDLKKQAERSNIVMIGNPPFGVKGKLATDFLNKGLKLCRMVGFIVPIQFRKWSVQSKVDSSAHLVLDITLPENAFTLLGKDYSLRCCFQVWTTESMDSDLRIPEKPSTTHPDFELYQYNRTAMAEKYFDFDWDFAVPRQGYQDYTRRVKKQEDCDRKQQWMFFKAKNKKILHKLMSMDFVKLSKKNSGIPGFGKADVVEEYSK